ncbi:MAG: hypothetical protein C0501_11230 [Isosphaera sp.]|nr:hypothetical protein [Isosphaera sp.]
MGTEDRLNALLLAWQEARAAGRDVPAVELCADAPELATELAARIVVLRRVGGLCAPTDPHPGGAFPPARLGRYRVVREVGRGGMGVVLEAEDDDLGRRVAVKVIDPVRAWDAGFRARFVREARAAAAVRHDHVVPIHDVGQEGDLPYFVMPFLDGESLADRLARGPLPPAEVARVGREAALGLAAAHAAGLVHRDVKPANLWLEAPDGRVKVLDFGLARSGDSADGAGAPGVYAGTPWYMSPEQASGAAPDPRADLFGLGAVLYECATGRRAFDGPTLTAVLRAVADHHPPPPRAADPAVPAALSDLVMRLLCKDPAGRPASAAAVADELTGLSGAPPAVEARRAARRRWPAVAAALVLVAGTGGWLALRRGDAAGHPAPPAPPAPAPPAAPTRGSVDLLVYRDLADGSVALVPLWDRVAMPLRTGDQFKFVAEVDRPAYLYLFWIDEHGAAVPVYPWEPGEWGTRPAAEEPRERLEVTAPGGRGFEVTGDGNGMETVLMLARPTRLEAGDEVVRGWFRDLKPLAFRGADARVWFENFDVLRSDRLRGLKYAGELTAADGPLGLQAEVGRRIGKGDAGYARAVSFARVGKREAR